MTIQGATGYLFDIILHDWNELKSKETVGGKQTGNNGEVKVMSRKDKEFLRKKCGRYSLGNSSSLAPARLARFIFPRPEFRLKGDNKILKMSAYGRSGVG